MKTYNILYLFFIFLFITGCASYMISGESLVEQLKANQKIAPNFYFQQFSLVDYPSNNLRKIKCTDKNGNIVWLYPDKNTEFIITRKSDGEEIKAYFDTVVFQNDTLYGLRSRLLGGLRKIPINDIKEVVITAEFPKVELISDNK